MLRPRQGEFGSGLCFALLVSLPMSSTNASVSSRGLRRVWPAILLSLAVLLASCSNYDFSRVRRADGSYDLVKLRAELKESGHSSFQDVLWIPLIYTRFTAFSASHRGFPKGHSLIDGQGFGPLFMVNQVDAWSIDEEGGPVESSTQSNWFWALARFWDEQVETVHGTREVDSSRWLFGLFGNRKVGYVKPG